MGTMEKNMETTVGLGFKVCGFMGLWVVLLGQAHASVQTQLTSPHYHYLEVLLLFTIATHWLLVLLAVF